MKRETFIILMIFVLALVPRLYHISGYLPDYFHPDEDKEIRRAISLYQGEFQQRAHKGMLFVLLAIEYGLLYGYEWVIGQVNSPHDFALEFVKDHSILFILSRITVAFMGAGCAVLAYRIVRYQTHIFAGILAALLITVFSEHLILSRLGRLDVPLCFWILLFIDLSIRSIQSPTTVRIFFIACLGGLVTATKTSGLPFLLVGLPAFINWLKLSDDFGKQLKNFTLAVSVFLLTIFIFNHALIEAILSLKSGVRPFSALEQYSGNTPNKFENYLNFPLNSLGILVILLAFFAIGYIGFKGLKKEKLIYGLLLGAIFLQVTLVWVCSDLVSMRYVLPSMIILILLAALGTYHLTSLFSSEKLRWISFSMLSLALVTPQLIQAKKKLHTSLLKPTVIAAKEWIEKNLPKNETIYLEGDKVFPSMYMPRLLQTRGSLEDKIIRLEETDPKKGELLRKFWLPSATENGYDIELYSYSREGISIKELQKETARYFVVREIEIKPHNINKWVKSYHTTLDQLSKMELIQMFEGDGENLNGLTLKVYIERSDLLRNLK